MTNLGGHDLEVAASTRFTASKTIDRPAFIAYTIKGYGLPFAGHKDNHAGMMSPEQVQTLQDGRDGVADGDEWEPFAGLDVPQDELRQFARLGAVCRRRLAAARGARASPVPEAFEPLPVSETMSTQQADSDACSPTSRARTRSWPITSSRRRPT